MVRQATFGVIFTRENMSFSCAKLKLHRPSNLGVCFGFAALFKP